jgi:sugar phosphate isomerase/epimerase
MMLAAGAALASTAAARGALAQAPAPAVTKLKIDTYSRHLLWLRQPDEVAKAVLEMGYDGIDLCVRPGATGHVEPDRVATDLAPFVKVLRDSGVRVQAITCPITDADSPNAERILDAASKLGIHHYWWGTFRYDQAKPVMPQLDALKPRVDKLAKLNAKYGMKAMYHNYSGPGTVGSAIWDLLEVLREFDSRHVSFHFDTGHAANAGGNNTWALNMRAAGPYVGGLSIKDSLLEFDPNAGQPRARPPGAPAGGPPGAPAGRLPPAADGPVYPWRVRYTPLGKGNNNLPLLAEVLKQIQFAGPVEIQAEYPNGGADAGRDQITLPRAEVLGNMRKDLETLKAAWAGSGLI